MPDVVVDAGVVSNFNRRTSARWIVGVDANNYYCFMQGGASVNLEYRKSVDGGATWAANVTVHVGNTPHIEMWFDQWTPGDTGTLIHIALLDATANTVSYYNLDTADDTLSAETVIAAVPVDSSTSLNRTGITISKARGGNIYVQYWNNPIGGHAFVRSTDGGASFVARTDGADGVLVDHVLLFPGNEADDQDMWMAYWDRSATEITLKTHDDSANTWAETVISAAMTAQGADVWQMSGAIRHSDNHLILAAWSQFDDAAADLRVWDINGAASIVPQTNVITNTAEAAAVAVTVINTTEGDDLDDIYIGYLSGAVMFATVDCHYQKSTDGGTTWDGETTMSVDASDDFRAITATLSINNDGGLFLPAWFEDDLNNIFVNTDNAVTIDPVTPTPPVEPGLPEYGQGRASIGDPAVYGATIVRS